MEEKKRYELDTTGGILDLQDTKNMICLNDSEIVDLLNQQDQRIAELEEQLKNSIRPKFKVNDRIFVIVNNEVEEYYIDEVLLKVKGTLVAYRDICKETTITEKNELFATKEEAQAKLEELKGENNEN